MRVNIKYLSLIVFALPILTVIISYIISVKLNLISFCIPNIDGCTSISRAGRYEPVKYFFKPFMFLFGVLLFIYWRENFLKLNSFLRSSPLTITVGPYLFDMLLLIFSAIAVLPDPDRPVIQKSTPLFFFNLIKFYSNLKHMVNIYILRKIY